MSNYVQTIDYAASDADAQFARSIYHTGFAVLSNHPISHSLLSRIYRGWLAFFASEDKYDYQYDRQPDGSQHGYFSLAVSEKAVGHKHKDIKEFFHAGANSALPAGLQDDIGAYRIAALALGRELLGWLQHALPAGCLPATISLADTLDDSASLLRVLHYPPLAGNEPPGSERAAAHEDINFITLLPVSEQAGLQVLARDGQWIDLHGTSGGMIVNTGDMLREMTGGYLPSTTHRVVNPQRPSHNVSRISLPLFLSPQLDLRLSERYLAGEYLAERLAAIDGSQSAQ